jgi:hypothetical protein
MHICTVATHSDRYFPVLKASCERFGAELTVLGWGEKWQGFAWKFAKMLEYLQQLPDDAVVMFVDGYDVILLQSTHTIEKRFHASNAQMIVAKDGIHPTLMVRYFMSKCFHEIDGNSVNTGTYIGYAGYLKQFLSMMAIFSNNFASGENDQEIASRIWKQFPDMVAIDHTSEFFVTLYGGSLFLPHNRIEWQNGFTEAELQGDGQLVVKNMETGINVLPCVAHGPCNTNLNEILLKLGYKIPEAVLRYSTLNHLKYMAKAFHSYAPFMILWLVVWVVAIMCVLYCLWIFSQWAMRKKQSIEKQFDDVLKNGVLGSNAVEILQEHYTKQKSDLW